MVTPPPTSTPSKHWWWRKHLQGSRHPGHSCKKHNQRYDDCMAGISTMCSGWFVGQNLSAWYTTFCNLSADYHLIRHYTSSHLLFFICGLNSLNSSMYYVLFSLACILNFFVLYLYPTGESLVDKKSVSGYGNIFFLRYILKNKLA